MSVLLVKQLESSTPPVLNTIIYGITLRALLCGGIRTYFPHVTEAEHPSVSIFSIHLLILPAPRKNYSILNQNEVNYLDYL